MLPFQVVLTLSVFLGCKDRTSVMYYYFSIPLTKIESIGRRGIWKLRRGGTMDGSGGGPKDKYVFSTYTYSLPFNASEHRYHLPLLLI